jgi:hypothetical protein
VKGGNTLDATPLVIEFGGTLRSLTTEGLYRLQKRVKEVSMIIYAIILFIGSFFLSPYDYPVLGVLNSINRTQESGWTLPQTLRKRELHASGFPFKPLAEMSGKVAYIRPMWSDLPRILRKRELRAPGCPFSRRGALVQW